MSFLPGSMAVRLQHYIASSWKHLTSFTSTAFARLWASPGKVKPQTQKCCKEPTCQALRYSSWKNSYIGLDMWFGWMTHLVKVVFISELATGVLNITCPLKRFKDGLKASLGLCSIPTFGWETLATDHNAWRMTIHKGIQSFEEKWLHDLDQKHQACKKRRLDPSTAVACPQCGCICASNCRLRSHLQLTSYRWH